MTEFEAKMKTPRGVSTHNEVHIVPITDKREHVASVMCWCKPMRDEENVDIIVHNSETGETFVPGKRLSA